MIKIIYTDSSTKTLECERVQPFEYMNRSDIQEVSLTDIQSVGMGAFNGCENLQAVEIKNVDNIEIGAFKDCKNLKKMICNDSSFKFSNLIFGERNDVEIIFNSNTFNANDESILCVKIPNKDIFVWSKEYGGVDFEKTRDEFLNHVTEYISETLGDHNSEYCKIKLDISEVTDTYRQYYESVNGKDNNEHYRIISASALNFISNLDNYYKSKIVEIILPKDIDVLEGYKDSIFICDYIYSPLCGFDNLETVVLPEKVKQISNRSFDTIKNLREVIFPENCMIESIEGFNECESLVTIQLPETVSSIGSYAFRKCTMLKNVDLSYLKITRLGTKCFKDCTSLSEIKLPNTLEEFGFDWELDGCSKLTKIYFPESVRRIYFRFLANCKSLEIININSNSDLILNDIDILKEIRSLKYIYIKNKETYESIIEYLEEFGKDKEIIDKFRLVEDMNKEIIVSTIKDGDGYNFGYTIRQDRFGNVHLDILPDSTKIPECYFQGNTDINIINIPASVEIIECYAFKECTNLRQVNIENTSVLDISDNAFYGCYSLQTDIYTKEMTQEDDNYQHPNRGDWGCFYRGDY